MPSGLTRPTPVITTRRGESQLRVMVSCGKGKKVEARGPGFGRVSRSLEESRTAYIAEKIGGSIARSMGSHRPPRLAAGGRDIVTASARGRLIPGRLNAGIGSGARLHGTVHRTAASS